MRDRKSTHKKQEKINEQKENSYTSESKERENMKV